MKIIVCIDKNNGMMFNNRRQSQDKILIDDIIKVTKDKKLYMNEYSYNLYKDKKYKNIIVCNDFLNKCSPDDFCLVENSSLVTYENKIDTIIIYNWNRNYPSDFKFDINIKDNNWTLIKSENLKGNSHDKITKNIYRRNNNEK
ncbi:MAG: ribonuclease Z [Clostridiales bacterium]|nr:ribonuclease Z [Clostridiales bacterium]